MSRGYQATCVNFWKRSRIRYDGSNSKIKLGQHIAFFSNPLRDFRTFRHFQNGELRLTLYRKKPTAADVVGSAVFCSDLWNNCSISKKLQSIAIEVMSTYTRRKLSPQWQHSILEQKKTNHCSRIQPAVVPGKRTDAEGRPFPNKPLGHRRLKPRTQDSLEVYEFEKINITEESRDSSLSQGHHVNSIGEAAGPQQPRKDLHRLSRRELQMARAIHAKGLMLQEKLWRVEGVIRQKIQGDGTELKCEVSHDGGQEKRGKPHTKTSLSMGRREMLILERRLEDVKQLRRKQDPRNEDRMRNAHEKEGTRWERREVEAAEYPRSKRNENKGTLYNPISRQKVRGEVNNSRWENVKDHTGGKRDDANHHIWGEASLRQKNGVEKAKESEQNETPIANISWTKEKKYKERMYREMCSSHNEQEKRQVSQEKTATGNHTHKERKTSRELSLLPVSTPSHFSGLHKEDLGLMDGKDTDFHLLPCRICNRKFKSDRLEKHVQICKKVNQSHRQVFNSYVNRTKGSAIEEFYKTHSRRTPEVLQKKNRRQNHKANTQGQLQA